LVNEPNAVGKIALFFVISCIVLMVDPVIAGLVLAYVNRIGAEALNWDQPFACVKPKLLNRD
jgi:hypothetical protein